MYSFTDRIFINNDFFLIKYKYTIIERQYKDCRILPVYWNEGKIIVLFQGLMGIHGSFLSELLWMT